MLGRVTQRDDRGKSDLLLSKGDCVIPNDVKIGPMLYEIVETDDFYHEGKKLYGYVNVSRGTLTLEASLCSQAKRITLWHEIVHAILVNAGMGDHEESLVEALSAGIVSMLDDNPSFR